MMTWQKKTGTSRNEISVTLCKLSGFCAVKEGAGQSPGGPVRRERGRQTMQNAMRDLMSMTIKDYAEELRRLIETEQERSASLMRRIDQSMDVIQRTERLLGK